MQIIGVEVAVNYIFILFDIIPEDAFEIFIVPGGLTVIFLVCCVHSILIQDVCDL